MIRYIPAANDPDGGWHIRWEPRIKRIAAVIVFVLVMYLLW